MDRIYSVRIRWIDDNSELDVLIAESYSIDDLPEGYIDEDIFFYGMSENNIRAAMESKEHCENEWVILNIYEEEKYHDKRRRIC